MSILLIIYNFNESDALTDIGPISKGPNERYTYDPGKWITTSNVDTFFSRFNHDNGYKDGDIELKLGDCVTIQDRTYNAVWVIAGFDMEHNQTAADGTVYDNGYGICMIPKTYVGSDAKWNSSDTVSGGYKSSNVHTNILPTVTTKLKNVLGSHLINRNVLLSSSVNSSGYSNAYTWTTSYATLMSVGQLTGTFASHKNKYDDGEANYKLPLFNYTDYSVNAYYWLRNINGKFTGGYQACDVPGYGGIGGYNVTQTISIRPMIYLR